MCTYNVQPIITLLLLLFSSTNSYEFIEKELTVQVTSKRSCACYSQLSGTNWAYVDHVQTQALFLPPPHPHLSPVPDQGHQESRGGEGEESLLIILSPVLRPNSPTALIHQIFQLPLSYLMGHPSLERNSLTGGFKSRVPVHLLIFHTAKLHLKYRCKC